MSNQDPSRSDIIASAIRMLKRVRRIAQLSPFIYALAYIVILLLYNVASPTTLDVLDDLFYISPIVIIFNVVLSRALKCCAWHRVACILPLLPQAVNLADPFLVVLPMNETIIFNYTVAVMSVLFLIAAYKVLLCDGC